MRSYMAKRVNVVNVVYVQAMCICKQGKVVGVGQNKRCCLRAQKKRMTGVRYGLRADKLWWRITNERRPRSEVREEESRAAAVDEAPGFA